MQEAVALTRRRGRPANTLASGSMSILLVLRLMTSKLTMEPMLSMRLMWFVCSSNTRTLRSKPTTPVTR